MLNLRKIVVVKTPSRQSIPPQPMSGTALPVISKTTYSKPVPKVNYNGNYFASVFNPIIKDGYMDTQIHASGYFTKLKGIKRSWSLATNNDKQINVVYYTNDRFKTIKNVGSTFGLLSFLNPFKVLLNAINDSFLKQFPTKLETENELSSTLDGNRKSITDDGVLYAWCHANNGYILTKKGIIYKSVDAFNYDIETVGNLEPNVVRVNPGVITYLEYINR